ncbi:MAG TPA: penicillin-binding protein 2 [Actinomycetaceae bacterium]|nr:penicillin-binding protein 2 [Actinomycetaceae bacterium]
MNVPLRRLGLMIGVMLIALMLSTTVVQFFQAPSLNADSRNVRTIYRQYSTDRGPIVVAGESVAWSEPTDDPIYQFQRVYGQGSLYAHLTGYFSVAHNSSTGVERYANEVLGGTADSLLLSRIQDLFTGRQPQGGSVELTIDPAVQSTMASVLERHTGAAVALNPKTGAILGMYSSPSFDPNLIAVRDREAAEANYQALLEDPDRPMDNRAIGGILYAPGSTFKVVTTAAYLEGDPARDAHSIVPTAPQLTLPQTTNIMHNPGGLACGPTDTGELIYAFRNSCNTTFAQLAMDMGHAEMAEMTSALGFGQELSIPLTVTPSVYPEVDSDAQLALTAIGQFDVRMSVLQNAMVAAAVANDGVLMTPYLIEVERDADLGVIGRTDPSEFSRPFSERTAASLTEMMIAVVNDGTGRPAQLSGVQIAGKTGTAETGTARAQHAWMIAFAPADDPQIALAVVLEHGGALGTDAYGGSAVGPLIREIVRAAVQ